MTQTSGNASRNSGGGRAERLLNAVLARAFSPVDIAPLVWFRILFGVILAWEAYRYYSTGWIARYYIEPIFHFKYYGFHWVEPWPGDLMYLHFAAMGALAIMIAIGFCYRMCMALYFIAHVYVFLLDSTRYLNHNYLVAILCFILIFIPAHRSFSVDAWLRPKLRASVVPGWALWWLRIQLGIVYTYAAIAKMNGDWLRGEPMRIWLGNRTDTPIFGQFFTEEWAVYLMSYGGMFLDLLIVPLLLWRRTLLPALFFGISFHLMNAQLFGIGIFPWFMIASMALFLPANWLRFGGLWKKSGEALTSAKRRARAARAAAPEIVTPNLQHTHYLSIALIGVFLIVQIAFPLRHHFYPGDVAWNEDGHRFSWRMMLRTKHGDAVFHVTDPATNQTWSVEPRDLLLSHQAPKVATHPDMILQFSHFLAQMYRDEGYDDVEVRAVVNVSLNGRPRVPYVDPDVNLAAIRNTFRATTWIDNESVVPLRALAD